MELELFFKNQPKVALCFSGGVDSSYLLYAAVQYNVDVKPYLIKTSFQPEFELEDAKRLAAMLGVEMTVLEMNILQNHNVVKNDTERCYHCKRALLGRLKEAALADGYTVIIDGNNASDDASDRPGMRAAKEYKVRSPLRECGLTKPEIRMHSKKAGLFTWDKPAYACLATRMPTGMKISQESLSKVDKAENVLFSLGFSDFRVRMLGESARIQVPEEQMPLLLLKREEIQSKFRGFSGVFLDLTPRG